jgi:hypothetical protein
MQVRRLAKKKQLTISDFIRESLGFPVLNNLIERVSIVFDLPYGGITELSKRIGHRYDKVYRWQFDGIPKDLAENICKVIEQIREDYKKPDNPKLITNGYLGKLSYGMIAQVARELNRPYNTVHNWHKYGIPFEHREAVRLVKERLDYE